MSTRVFRLFPTKLSLFLAVVERSFQQIQETLERAARAAGATGEPALMAMAASGYRALPRSEYSSSSPAGCSAT
jgi:AcrR family transcriptional regulator